MNILQKTVFSCLLALFLVAGIAGLLITGVFSFAEWRLLNIPTNETLVRQTAADAQLLNDFLTARGPDAGEENVPEGLTLVRNPHGFVAGLPLLAGSQAGIPAQEIIAEVSAIWADSYRVISAINVSGIAFTLVSIRMDNGSYYGRIVNEPEPVVIQENSIPILAAIYFTLFLLIFFILNCIIKFPQKTSSKKAKQKRASEPIIISTEDTHDLEELQAYATADTGANPRVGLLAAAKKMSAQNGSLSGAGLEVVSPFASMFSTFEEPLPQTGGEVILEENGVPYINSSAISHNINTDEINDGFSKLVDAVVNEKH